MVDLITQLESAISANWATATHTPKPSIFLAFDPDDLFDPINKEYIRIFEMVSVEFLHRHRVEVHNVHFFCNACSTNMTSCDLYTRRSSMLSALSEILQKIADGTVALTGIAGFEVFPLTQTSVDAMHDGARYLAHYEQQFRIYLKN